MLAILAACAMMVGQVGSLMGGSESGGAPGGGFAITTEGNSPLATESSSIIVTEAAP